MAADPYSAAAMFGFHLVNGLQQAELVRQQGEITDLIAQSNKESILNDAFETLASGMTEEARYSNVIKHVLETQKNQMAYAGVDASYGSAADIQAESAVQGLVNQATIRNNAYAATLGLKREALNVDLQNQFDRSSRAQRIAAIQSRSLMEGVSSAFKAYSAPTAPASAADQGGSDAMGTDLGVQNYELGGYGYKFR